ncbi:MAG: hypothetical protein U0324_10985 [Polyangiales bacterium]
MSIENRQKIPVPRRSFLWSLNETSGEILLHVGPTEFTPSANDRIVRANERGGFEQAPMEARPFIVARDGEYVVLTNPLRGDASEEYSNGMHVPGGNKEKELLLGTTRIIAGPCAFPLWPGQSAEVRPAHKLGANHYLLVEVVGTVDERARYYKLVIASAELSSAVIDAGGDATDAQGAPEAGPGGKAPSQLRLGQRIVIQGRHTQLFIPPSGIEIVAPMEDVDPSQMAKSDTDEDGIATLPPAVQQECARLVAQVREGMSAKQFSVLKNELRHRGDLTTGQRAIVLTALDAAFDERGAALAPRVRRSGVTGERRAQGQPMDPYARRAVVLGPKEFCILFDADGNPRIVRGPARVFPGPHDTFLQRGSRRRVYDAYELAEHQALWLRIIAPIPKERLALHLPPGVALDRDVYPPGHEMIVRGQPSVFFPFIEAEVIHPETREPHVGNDHDAVVLNAIGVDQKSGVYVRDLRTGMVKMVRGETSYLVDPRYEEHVHRRVPREQWNLWIGRAEPHKVTRDEAVTTPWAISVTVPNNEAVLITSRHGRRVEVGPKVALLDYEESLTALQLSKGPSKDGKATVTTCFLRVRGGRVSDSFELDSADFVRFKVRLGFAGHFEGEGERWFQVEDPVKLLADTVRSRLREVARATAATRLLAELPALVRGALFGQGDALRFEENGMVIDRVDVLASSVADSALAELFNTVQRESVKLQLQDQQATRRLESARHQDGVDADQQLLARGAVQRKAETDAHQAEASHALATRTAELAAERRAAELARGQQHQERVLEFEVRTEREMAEAAAARRVLEAEASARAAELAHKVEESHLEAVARVEAERARALAEADAVKLQAVQAELVGALHAAADSEVMKAAANNMNLVALLGGRSPAELFEQLLKGTPLARTARDMRERAGDDDAG